MDPKTLTPDVRLAADAPAGLDALPAEGYALLSF